MLQQWEDEVVIARQEAELQQRIVAATLLADPELKIASALFGDGELEETDDGEMILYPSSEEEYEAMLEMFDDLGVDLSSGQ